MKLKENDLILFIGDSITDVGRDRMDGSHLGAGYPLMVAGALAASYPERKLRFLNRGIGGDKVRDLQARWEEDCLALQPDVLSILIGINDTWHNASRGEFGVENSLREFEQAYRDILTQARKRTSAQIVILEPFVLPYPEDRREWRVDLDPRIQVVRQLAEEFAVDFIPLDGRFNALGMKTGYPYLTGEDGVHPTVAGHGVIAQAWLEAVEN